MDFYPIVSLHQSNKPFCCFKLSVGVTARTPNHNDIVIKACRQPILQEWNTK